MSHQPYINHAAIPWTQSSKDAGSSRGHCTTPQVWNDAWTLKYAFVDEAVGIEPEHVTDTNILAKQFRMRAHPDCLLPHNERRAARLEVAVAGALLKPEQAQQLP